jgi:hypothetical protein
LVDSIKSDSCVNVYGFTHQAKLELENAKYVSDKERYLKLYFDEKKMNFLMKCIQTEPESTSSGISYLIQSAGMAGLEPNTILTAFPEGYHEETRKAKRFFEILQ